VNGLEVITDETKCMALSQDKIVGQRHHINFIILPVEELKYLETTLTNRNSIQQEIKRRLMSGNVCVHSM